ncbi:hypothetical protein [Bacillus toyonensis]|uniref:flagellar biosynthesis protein FlhF n=1 Tax=Bacillus toyonensis TaxID=155322 RepID=UPI002E21B3A1|nr:hypothetical protein [Bacillus toyonensis]
MSQLKVEKGLSPEEIYQKIEEEHGKNYNILNKNRKKKYVFPFRFRTEYIYEYEITKQPKKDKKAIIEVLKQAKVEKTKKVEMGTDTPNIEATPTPAPVVNSVHSPEIYDYLVEQELDEKWIRHLIELAEKEQPQTVLDWKEKISNIIESEMQDWVEKNDFQILTLFGPTGVGKTTTLIKIMNRLQSGNKKIGVITTDNFRVGAYEQMNNYSEKLDFPLIQSNVAELTVPVNVLKHQKGMDYILIDTYGRNPKDKEMKDEIQMYLNTVNPESVSLVLAANQKYKDMVKTIQAYNDVKIDHLIITKIDETDSLGFIYNLYKEFNIPISYLTFGQKVPGDIETFSSKAYVKRLWESFSI